MKPRALRRYCIVHGYDERRILASFDWCRMHEIAVELADEIARLGRDLTA